jgi:hypothetical protein
MPKPAPTRAPEPAPEPVSNADLDKMTPDQYAEWRRSGRKNESAFGSGADIPAAPTPQPLKTGRYWVEGLTAGMTYESRVRTVADYDNIPKGLDDHIRAAARYIASVVCAFPDDGDYVGQRVVVGAVTTLRVYGAFL